MDTIRKALQSRVALLLGLVVAVAVPVATAPRLPALSPWPLLAGLVPWILGKYGLCALRWRAVASAAPDAPKGRVWYLRTHAESEFLGLLTPGHVGADLWRVKQLHGAGVARGDAVTSVALDRFAGAIGLAVFMAFAASELPTGLVLATLGVAAVAVVVVLAARRWRPRWLPGGPLPSWRALCVALLLAAGYQLTIAGLLLGTIAATGHSLSPLQVLAAFGASQAAAVVPGVNGASPRDGALVVALVAFGLPLVAAAAAVTVRAALAWLPALALGGLSLALLRRQRGPLRQVSAAAF